MSTMDVSQLRSTRRAIFFASNIAVTILLSFVFLLWTETEASKAEQRNRVQASDVVGDFSEELNSKLNRVLLVGSGFSGAIALDPDIEQSDYTRFATSLPLEDASVVNIAAIRDMRIALVHPYEGNANLVGRDLHDIPEQFKVATLVQNSGTSVLQGPTRLIQGYDGFILRQPIYVTEDTRRIVWGLLTIVFTADGFFDGFQSEDILGKFDIAVRNESDQSGVFGNQDVFAAGALVRPLEIPGGFWEIAILPKAGWRDYQLTGTFKFAYVVALLLSLLVANTLIWQREKALRASEQLQAAIDVLADGFVLYDKDDRLVICNKKYYEFYSDSAPAIFPGAYFKDILQYGLDRQQYADAIGREAEWLERRLAAHNGSDITLVQKLATGRWLRIRDMPTPEGGRVGIRSDITEQMESRERVRIAENRLRDAIRAVPAGFWLFDANLRLDIVNDRALEPFREAPESIKLGETLEEVVDHLLKLELSGTGVPEVAVRRRQLLDLLRRKSASFEVRIAENRWFQYFSQRTKEGGLVCFGVEISELKNHEVSLQLTNERMRAALLERDEAEARFEDVADISTEWFWEQDANHRLSYLSPGFSKATGIPPQEFLGRTRMELISGSEHDNEGEDPREALKEKIERYEPFEDIIYSTVRPDGTRRWFRTSGKPVFDKNGVFCGYRGTAADVTQLYSALREAKRADEAKTQFLNVISHELRTPITIVLGFNAFLRQLERLPEFAHLSGKIEQSNDQDLDAAFDAAIGRIEGIAAKIDSAGEQLRKLIQDVLDLARIEANTMQINLVPVDAARVVGSIIEQIEPIAEGKDITFEADVESMALETDEVRLRQVLINLVSNAVKYTDRGRISIRGYRRDREAVFEIADTGVGIPSHALESIFHRFTQVDASATRSQGGVGLGLAISKELVGLLGGTIEAASTEGEGTKITFTLPL